VLSSGVSGRRGLGCRSRSNLLDPNSNPVYYPAVSLALWAAAALRTSSSTTRSSTSQISRGANRRSGLPQWNLAFFSTAVRFRTFLGSVDVRRLLESPGASQALVRRISHLLAAALLASQRSSRTRRDEAPVRRQRAEQARRVRRARKRYRARGVHGSSRPRTLAGAGEGRCLLRLGQYRESIASAHEGARAGSVALGVSGLDSTGHFHLGRDSTPAIRGARPRRTRESRTTRAPSSTAASCCRDSQTARSGHGVRSARRGSTRATPDLRLYAGRTWRAYRTARGEGGVERAHMRIRLGVGRSAAAELEQLDAANRRHVWAKLRGGVEHDSNVTLQNEYVFGSLRSRFQRAHQRDDTVAVVEGEARPRVLPRREQSAGGAAGYNGNAHDNVHELDLQYPWVTSGMTAGSPRYLGSPQPFYGYAWLEGDPFVSHGAARSRSPTPSTTTSSGPVFARGNYNEFLYHLHFDPRTCQFVRSATAMALEARRRRGHLPSCRQHVAARVAPPTRTTGPRGRDWDRNGCALGGRHQQLPWRWCSRCWRTTTTSRTRTARATTERRTDMCRVKAPRDRPHLRRPSRAQLPRHRWAAISARAQYTSAESTSTCFDYDPVGSRGVTSP
jgi:hypothetical protein